MKYGLHNKLTARAGKGEMLADILMRASNILKEKADGCVLYMVSRDAHEPDTVWVTEVWESRSSHEASLQLPEVRTLILEARPMFAGVPTQGPELEVLAY